MDDVGDDVVVETETVVLSLPRVVDEPDRVLDERLGLEESRADSVFVPMVRRLPTDGDVDGERLIGGFGVGVELYGVLVPL